MSIDIGAQALLELGFTALEAEVYIFLLQEPATTGYRIAQVLGRQAPNVYKAIETLESKGAVLVEEGSSRVCRAIPIEEVLGRLQRRFDSSQKKACDSLHHLRSSTEDDRVYQLRSVDQVMDRCRNMLSRCKTVALFDIFPQPLEALRPEIESAAHRGARIVVKTFSPSDVVGVDVILNPRGEEIMDQYPGQWLICLVDASELLIASFDAENNRIHQAIWSSSVTLSYIFHCSFSAEIMLIALLNSLQSGITHDNLMSVVKPLIWPGMPLLSEIKDPIAQKLIHYASIFGIEAPGYNALLSRFGAAESQELAEAGV